MASEFRQGPKTAGLWFIKASFSIDDNEALEKICFWQIHDVGYTYKQKSAINWISI